MASVWNATGVASVSNGSTVVSTTSDFTNDFINEGAGFRFADETVLYEIVGIDAAANTFTLHTAYTGTTKAGAAYQIVPFSGAARSAERAFLEAKQTFGAMLSADPFNTTIGRVMRVGDFGEHGAIRRLSSANDLDDVRTPGVYDWLSSDAVTNAPASGSYGLQVREIETGTILQIVTRVTGVSGSLDERFRVSTTPGTWTAWATRYHTRNAVGTVSISSGIPTGALFERGGGTVGTMTWEGRKSADGWLSMRMEVRVDVTSTSSQTFTYPTGWAFANGTIPGGTFRNLDNAPNAALLLTNVAMFDVNTANCQIRLAAGGTSSDVTSAAEKMVFSVEGRFV